MRRLRAVRAAVVPGGAGGGEGESLDTGTKMIEELAEFAHNQWSGWMIYLFSKCTLNDDGTMTIPVWAVERWQRQAQTHYLDLPDDEKESDRKEARKVLEIMEVKMQEDELRTKSVEAAIEFLKHDNLQRHISYIAGEDLPPNGPALKVGGPILKVTIEWVSDEETKDTRKT